MTRHRDSTNILFVTVLRLVVFGANTCSDFANRPDFSASQHSELSVTNFVACGTARFRLYPPGVSNLQLIIYIHKCVCVLYLFNCLYKVSMYDYINTRLLRAEWMLSQSVFSDLCTEKFLSSFLYCRLSLRLSKSHRLRGVYIMSLGLCCICLLYTSVCFQSCPIGVFLFRFKPTRTSQETL